MIKYSRFRTNLEGFILGSHDVTRLALSDGNGGPYARSSSQVIDTL